MIASDLKPYKKPKIFDIRATNDKFIVVVDALTNAKLQADLGQIMRDAGAEEVNEKSFD
jgi:cell division septation protein DedD